VTVERLQFEAAEREREQRGRIPAKRHVAFREEGRLLTEEVMGFEGFSGNESILYHLESPCRVGELGSLTALERDEWVPAAHEVPAGD
jgi:homogentisate 1,2-dioxygenase